MKNLIKSMLIITFLIAFQIGNHKIFVNPYVSEWGASNAEFKAAMPNDDKADFIVSTRAITINKPLDETWLWINQLGADRGGFFSYYFIEKMMGYYTHEQDIITANFPPFIIDDVVRGSITPKTSLILFEFPVTDVKANEYFTLANWGTFLLKPVNQQSTRLIIRTHRQDRGSFIANKVDYIAYALHYIMERATLNGLKQRIEAGVGEKFSPLTDQLWFTFIVISGLFIAALTFLFKGVKSILIPLIFSSLWLVTLFILPAIPLYSGILSAIIMMATYSAVKRLA